MTTTTDTSGGRTIRTPYAEPVINDYDETIATLTWRDNGTDENPEWAKIDDGSITRHYDQSIPAIVVKLQNPRTCAVRTLTFDDPGPAPMVTRCGAGSRCRPNEARNAAPLRVRLRYTSDMTTTTDTVDQLIDNVIAAAQAHAEARRNRAHRFATAAAVLAAEGELCDVLDGDCARLAEALSVVARDPAATGDVKLLVGAIRVAAETRGA